MTSPASDLTGWWIGFGIAAAVVVIVVVVVVAIIATAKKIGDVAEDATRTLAQIRDRTEVLWQVATTNSVASDLLQGATQARHALGGGNGDAAPSGDGRGSAGEQPTTIGSRKGLGGVASGLAGHSPPQHPTGEGGPA